jgi:hypothetical protein
LLAGLVAGSLVEVAVQGVCLLAQQLLILRFHTQLLLALVALVQPQTQQGVQTGLIPFLMPLHLQAVVVAVLMVFLHTQEPLAALAVVAHTKAVLLVALVHQVKVLLVVAVLKLAQITHQAAAAALAQ